jgi:hypothetical protein
MVPFFHFLTYPPPQKGTTVRCRENAPLSNSTCHAKTNARSPSSSSPPRESPRLKSPLETASRSRDILNPELCNK